MNFVDLTERLRYECGVSGTQLQTVQNLNGELLRLRNWIRDAWQELQQERTDWKFMKTPFSFSLTPGVQRYSLATVQAANASIDIDMYKQDSFSLDLPGDTGTEARSAEVPLGVMAYNHFRNMYVVGYPIGDSTRWQQPMTAAIDDDRTLCFGPAPDLAYLIRGECWINPQILSADTDVPIMPAKYHNVIVYRAMKKYAGYESANDVRVRSVQEGNAPELTLFNEQLPQVTIDGGFDSNHGF
jgi:hypothetical protein